MNLPDNKTLQTCTSHQAGIDEKKKKFNEDVITTEKYTCTRSTQRLRAVGDSTQSKDQNVETALNHFHTIN